jgi:hypothetical protein
VLLPQSGVKAACCRALGSIFFKLGVSFPDGPRPAASAQPPTRQQVQQQLNDLTFLTGLGRMIKLLKPLIPPSLGEALVEHLTTWMDPAHVMKTIPHPDGPDKPPLQPCLPPLWRPGDELRAPAAVFALFEHLPESAVALLQTPKKPEPEGRLGLVVLSIELEQVPPAPPAFVSCVAVVIWALL